MLDIKKSTPVLVLLLALPSERFAHYFQFLSGDQLSTKVITIRPIKIMSKFINLQSNDRRIQAHLIIWSGSCDCSIKSYKHKNV